MITCREEGGGGGSKIPKLKSLVWGVGGHDFLVREKGKRGERGGGRNTMLRAPGLLPLLIGCKRMRTSQTGSPKATMKSCEADAGCGGGCCGGEGGLEETASRWGGRR